MEANTIKNEAPTGKKNISEKKKIPLFGKLKKIEKNHLDYIKTSKEYHHKTRPQKTEMTGVNFIIKSCRKMMISSPEIHQHVFVLVPSVWDCDYTKLNLRLRGLGFERERREMLEEMLL